ncbi:hypothetical protein COLO4_26574 [Corchorus olitorius]|uniref:Uncharacterized protein n=1 Tax=Corchorus olitorius TaxID=93759 RepID=A0A1R3HW64_9ROSI|nr:hypothetical protein COLO4_26574 [Corchorus olitorius]
MDEQISSFCGKLESFFETRAAAGNRRNRKTKVTVSQRKTKERMAKRERGEMSCFVHEPVEIGSRKVAELA